MATPLFTVESTFTIKGRALVLMGITLDQYGTVKVGNPLTIKRPDGSIVQAQVIGIEYPPSVKWAGERPSNPRYGVLVDVGLDVPVGSVVTADRRSE